MKRDLTNPNRIAVDWVTPVTEAAVAPPMFLLPGNQDEGSGFRRLAEALGPAYPLAIVRPQSKTWFTDSPFMMEDAIAVVMNLCQKSAAGRPFILGGFCLGGVMAWEAARQMTGSGLCRGVMMFDAALPGYPNPLTPWHWQTTPEIVRGLRAVTPQQRRFSFMRLTRKPLWHLVLHLRRLMRPWWDARLLRAFHLRARHHDQPYVWVRPIKLPVLHCISNDAGDLAARVVFMPWKLLARGPFQLVQIPAGHRQMFTRDGIEQITDSVRSWLNAGAE